MLCCAFVLNAAPSVQLGARISDAELKIRQQQLKNLMGLSSLSVQEKERLQDLMEQAAEIAEMNDRCGTISITELLDEECMTYYESAIPKFEQDYFKLTGEIQMNSFRFSKAMNDKRAMIDACYEGLPLSLFYPSAWLEVDGTALSEPLEKGFELAYDLTLKPSKHDYSSSVNNVLSEWYETCGDFIRSNTDAQKLAPLFVSKFERSKEDASDENGGLYFRLQGKNVYVASKTGIQGVYRINDEDVFEYLIMPDKPIFSIDLESGRVENYLQSGAWSGTKRYRRDDRGLHGMLVWDNASKSKVKAFQRAERDRIEAIEEERERERKREEKLQREEQARLREARGEGFSPYFQLLYSLGVGLPIQFADDEVEAVSKEYDLKDSSYQGLTYGAAMFYLEANSSVSFGIGAGYGYSWAYVDLSEESYHLLSIDAPVFVGELASHSEGFTIGVRGMFMNSSKYPAYTLGLFADLADLVGMEMAWFHTEKFADCFYIGFSIRLIPHRRYIKDKSK